jgi:hypothetical protein
MSMIRCDDCERLIDSDADCDCFVGTAATGDYRALCKWCREQAFDDLVAALHGGSMGDVEFTEEALMFGLSIDEIGEHLTESRGAE